MCGRFSLVDGTKVVEKRFGVTVMQAEFETFYNAALSMELPIVIKGEGSELDRVLMMAKWGLMPSWMHTTSTMRPMANARLETVAEKKMFAEAYRKRHCLVPANSFFEWSETEKINQPYLFRLKDNPLFAFAGIWEEPIAPGAPSTFALLTTQANSLMATLHHRLPVILKKEDEEAWLMGPDSHETRVIATQYETDQMEMHPVTLKVNKVSYQDPDVLVPVQAAPRLF